MLTLAIEVKTGMGGKWIRVKKSENKESFKY